MNTIRTILTYMLGMMTLIPVSISSMIPSAMSYGEQKHFYEEAVKKNDSSQLSALLAQYSALLTDEIKNELLHMAAYYNADRIAVMLIEQGADINALNKTGMTPFMTAALQGSLAALMAINIQAACQKISIIDQVNSQSGMTALHYAMMKGHAHVACFLLFGCNAAVNALDKNGWSPLAHAVHSQSEPLVIDCMAVGAEVNQPNIVGWTPLMRAANHGNSNLIELLCQNNAQVNYQQPSQGITPLMLAAGKGHAQAVVKLLQKGASIALTTHSQSTALMFAAEKGFDTIASYLLLADADRKMRDVVNNEGESALTIAVKNKHKNIVTLLLSGHVRAGMAQAIELAQTFEDQEIYDQLLFAQQMGA